jgi:ABC-type antimicrobial peptide transport system permease subunit
MNSTDIRYHNRPKHEIWSISTKPYDIHFLDTYGLKLVAGTNIPKSDTINGYLVNEETVKRLGINNPQEVVGKNISVSGNTARVYGVLKNWHTNSLLMETTPVVIYSYKDYYYHASIRFNTKNLGNTMREIQKLWSSYYPDDVFRKDFLDEFITRLYESEQAMLNLIRGFSFIAIFIGCLGMFGLIRFLASQKTKEIGVRKAYGATVGQILYLFVLEMLRLVVVAFVIAVSLGYYLMNMWLDKYAYRIDINTQIGFLAFVALSITFTLAILTIGYEAYKAAVKSPSLSLKSE